MPRRPLSSLAVAFSLLVACVSCAETPGHVDPEWPRAVPLARGEKLPVTNDPPRTRADSRTLGLVRDDPPETCFATDQPAIVQVPEADAGPRHPVWMCREGCAPGFELVTTASTSRRRHSSAELTSFTPTCEPWCVPGTHRISYVIDGSTAAENTCAPGDAPSAVMEARAREADRRVAAVAEAWLADVASIEAAVGVAEAARPPWSELARLAWVDADEKLSVVRAGLRNWFAHGREIARVGENYRGADEHVADVARHAFLTRVKASLPRDAFDRVGALASRVDRLRSEAARTEARATEARERDEARDEEIRRGAIDARLRSECSEGCGRERQRCNVQCAALTQGACDVCAIAETRCGSQCQRR